MERRDDPGLWSVVGYVQLTLGDIAAADRTFHKAAELFSRARSPDQQQQAQAIIRRHQGLLLFARNDFAGQCDVFCDIASDNVGMVKSATHIMVTHRACSNVTLMFSWKKTEC